MMSKEFKYIYNPLLTTQHNINDVKYINTAGTIALVCPKCFHMMETNVSLSNIAGNIPMDDIDNFHMETNFYGMCPECREQVRFIQLDINIAQTISILNSKGYYTAFCCEGHIELDEDGVETFEYPYIYFYLWSDSKILEIHPLPDTWYIQPIDKECKIFNITDAIDKTNPKTFDDKNSYKNYVEWLKNNWNQEKSLRDIYEWALSLPEKSEAEKLVKRDLIDTLGAKMLDSYAERYTDYQIDHSESVMDPINEILSEVHEALQTYTSGRFHVSQTSINRFQVYCTTEEDCIVCGFVIIPDNIDIDFDKLGEELSKLNVGYDWL